MNDRKDAAMISEMQKRADRHNVEIHRAAFGRPAATETSLVMRVCRHDLTSYNGFKWPADVGAEVSAPDWEKNEENGNGLHGWLYGQGNYSCASYWEDAEAKWMVLEVRSADIVMLDGWCKFPRALVRFIGTKSEAAAFIIANEPNARGVAVIGACVKGGDGEAIQVGALGTATAGYRGTATAGHYGTVAVGASGIATVGYCGTAMAGKNGEIRIQWFDCKAKRYRTKIGYVGEDGIKPNTAYCLNDRYEFEETKDDDEDQDQRPCS